MANIYQNSNGNPLKNSIGNVLSTNYNKGKLFKGTSTVYCNCPQTRSLSITYPYTIEILITYVSETNYRNSIIKLTGSTGSIGVMISAGDFLIQDAGANASNINLGSANTGVVHFVINSATSQSLYHDGVLKTTYTASRSFNLGNITGVNINGSASGDYSNAGINEIRVYKRLLTSVEIKEIAKLGAYNDVIYPQNLELRYKFDVCESVDISAALDGSSLVAGIKDFSGFNRHLRMNGLPALSLQQQIDYANSKYII